jgi:Holliday junction DNA helicase RuvA
MIGRITGVLLAKENQQALIDVQGVAYEVDVPLNTFFDLPHPGAPVTLHTHFIVREDAQLLYGFLDESTRTLFRILIRVNGVGPKLALSLLSGMDVGDFVRCVKTDDINALVKLPGVGRKTAERLILEVKDKLKEWQGGQAIAGNGETVPASAKVNSLEEAETALISLGYKPQEAARAVVTATKLLEESGQVADSESLIRTALRNMS